MNSSVKNESPVGVFDSGLGGLTVASSLRRIAPAEDIIYLGDTARVPYGDKSVENLRKFAVQDADFLLSRGVKLIVAACNTVSSVALDVLRSHCAPLPVIGVIEPGVRAALASGAKRIAVIGTRCTINSGAYTAGIHAVDPSVEVTAIASPLLVPLAEEGITSGPIAEQVLDLYLNPLRGDPPDAVLLACTHYPLFRNALMQYFGGIPKIIDSASACAEYTVSFLQTNHLSAPAVRHGRTSVNVTDFPSAFSTQANRFFGDQIPAAEKVVLRTLENTQGSAFQAPQMISERTCRI